ncbi:diacylglycerol kinase family lipid kinase [Eubacteriaceae bacterium ES3]|nr:diacylglycerol kinase family lipid kinase [Eubacteriaceae bacterium ES3]
MQKQNVLLIINSVAGRQKAYKKMYQIVSTLSKNNCKTTIFSTTKRYEATDLVIQYGSDYDKIICAGGDGTLNEVISGLAHLNKKIPLGYIPTGTTNDLANSLGLPTKYELAINTAMGDKIQQHDIGAFNEDQYFTYLASFGAFSKVSYSTPQWLKNSFGYLAYILHGIISLPKIHSYKVTVTADGEEIAGDFLFGSVSNSKSIGGVVKFLDSEVTFDDGKFEVLLIKNPTRLKDLRGINKGLFEHKYDNVNIAFLKADTVTFNFENSASWTIDGEYAGKFCDVKIKNLPSMVQFITL